MSLEEYTGKEVLIRVAGIPGSSGSSFYIDEIEISGTVNVMENETIQNSLVYPNPADLIIHFNSDSFLDYRYKVYSVLGNVVLDGLNIDNSIDISGLNPGAYYIRVSNKIFRIIKK